VHYLKKGVKKIRVRARVGVMVKVSRSYHAGAVFHDTQSSVKQKNDHDHYWYYAE